MKYFEESQNEIKSVISAEITGRRKAIAAIMRELSTQNRISEGDIMIAIEKSTNRIYSIESRMESLAARMMQETQNLRTTSEESIYTLRHQLRGLQVDKGKVAVPKEKAEKISSVSLEDHNELKLRLSALTERFAKLEDDVGQIRDSIEKEMAACLNQIGNFDLCSIFTMH